MERQDNFLYNSASPFFTAGTDEVGRGPLAGPVVACAVILPAGLVIDGVTDSKKLSAKKRERLSAVIKEQAVSWAIGEASEAEIDTINILQATLAAMARAVEKLKPRPDELIVDGLFAPKVDERIKVICLPHGDMLNQSVAAASIVAKVYRDLLMEQLHEEYPQYGFNRNKGYGTAEHIKALREYGPCPIHRRSFKYKIL
jgi:ribonuclease HII